MIEDAGSQGKRIDTSGPAVCKMIEDAGFHVIHTAIIPDEQAEIQKCSSIAQTSSTQT